MNPEQSYPCKRNSATIPCFSIFQSISDHEFDRLKKLQILSDSEKPFSGLIPSSNSMAPRIVAGGKLVIVRVKPEKFDFTTGIVALTTTTHVGYLVGRLEGITTHRLILGRDNPAFRCLQLNRSVVTSLHQVRYLTQMPVL